MATTTTFQDDGDVAIGKSRALVSTGGIVPFDANEIASFLGKPLIIASGDYSTGSSASTVLATFSIADAMESKTLWTEKLKGYRFVRATAKIKVVFNAQPFQAGRVILSFLPMAKHFNTALVVAKNSSLASITTQQNVELDIKDSSIEMDIPYLAPTYYYDRVRQWYDWGTVYLRALTALRTGSSGATTVPYDVFLSFDNVELAGPYSAESSLSRKPNTTSSRANRDNVSLTRKERNIVSEGQVASTLDKLSTATGILSDSIFSYIPGVSTVSNLMASSMGTVSDICAIFGWSKPFVVGAPSYMKIEPTRNMNNSSGGVASTVFGLSHDVSIKHEDKLYGTGADEMNFAFLKEVPSLIQSLTWSTTDPINTSLWSNAVAPRELATGISKTVGSTVTTARVSTPLFLMEGFFQGWRGSIVLTFKFVKTQFHTGRVMITYNPFTSAPASIDNSAFCIREIVDMSNSSEIKLTIPYTQVVPYLPTSASARYTALDNGRLDVRVLNPLRATETVNSTIDFLVYVQPGPDFEYVMPSPLFTNNKPPVAFSPESAMSSKLIPNEKVEKVLGSAEIQSAGLTENMLCVGDPVVSLKQLISIATKITYTTAPTGTVSNHVVQTPWPGIIAKAALSPNPLVPSSLAYGGFYDFVRNFYAMERGGFRYMIQPDTNLSTNSGSTAAPIRENVAYLTQSFNQNACVYRSNASMENSIAGPLSATFNPLQHTNVPFILGGGIDVIVPHYNLTPYRLTDVLSDTGVYIANNTNGRLPHRNPISLAVFGQWSSNANYRACADDFSLGYFSGVVPLLDGAV